MARLRSMQGRRRNSAKRNPVTLTERRELRAVGTRTHTVFTARELQAAYLKGRADAHGAAFRGRNPRKTNGRRARSAPRLPNPAPLLILGNPGGRPMPIPPEILRDPRFWRERAAYRRRHGCWPTTMRAYRTPDGYPKFASAWGECPEVKYNASRASNKGRRIHHFGERGGRKPLLVSSCERGEKFLVFLGGTFKAGGKWIER